MPFIDIAGESFHYEVDGPADAPVLLLSNSLATDMAMWDPQVPVWSKRFRVVRYDQRGHGLSSPAKGPYTMDRLGRDALELMDALGIEKANFCGLSMGGMAGMWLALNAPSRINQLVLSNTSTYLPTLTMWNERMDKARQGGMAAVADATIQRWFPGKVYEEAPEKAAQMRELVLRTPVEGFLGCCAAIRDMDMRSAIGAIQHDTLVIIGEHDPATTPEAGRYIQQSIKNSRLAVLDAAHISNVQRPKEFAAFVDEFLN